MLHSFDDTAKGCHITGKRIANGLKLVKSQRSKYISKFMCLSALGGSKKDKRKSVMSGSANPLDPDLRSEREIVARQLAHMGDNLLESYAKEGSNWKTCVALSVVAAGLAGVAIFFITKEKE